jgi:hypothetical protein
MRGLDPVVEIPAAEIFVVEVTMQVLEAIEPSDSDRVQELGVREKDSLLRRIVSHTWYE